MDFFTADLHFSHKNIISFCKRPYADIEEMNEAIVQNWNSVVRPNDRVYVVGDVAFGNHEVAKSLLSRLVGQKVLIMGNHDWERKKFPWLDYFDAVFDSRDGRVVKYAEFVVSHFPWAEKMGIYDQRDWLTRHAPKQNSDLILIHGHVHTSWLMKENMINVGVDVWDMKPVSVETIREEYRLHQAEIHGKMID